MIHAINKNHNFIGSISNCIRYDIFINLYQYRFIREVNGDPLEASSSNDVVSTLPGSEPIFSVDSGFYEDDSFDPLGTGDLIILDY